MATDLGVKVTEEGKYFFISYNTEDAELVSSYLKRMADYRLPVWYDYGIPQGDLWQTVIAEKIYNCESVIMFLSSKLFKKENSFVKKEWSIAKGRPKKVYIVILDQIDETSIPPQYAFWWSDIKETQSIQAHTMELDACVDKILDAVGFEKQNNSLNQTTRQGEIDFSQYPDFSIISGVLVKYKGKDTVVKIPYGVTAIYENAFSFDIITSIEIPDSVVSIGNSAFSCCRFLTSISIPNGVTSIGDFTFHDCISLTSIEIPSSVKTIGDNAFEDCQSLVNVVISDGVTSIGDSIFSGCKSLTSIVIPDSVKTIGDNAFKGCESLVNVVISDGVTSIGDNTFYGCHSLKNIKIPNDVTSIGRYTFFCCESLTSIEISNSVTSIGALAFVGCNSLTKIEVSENNTHYKSIDGNLYSKDEKNFILYPAGKSDTSFAIPNGVTTICASAFSGCKQLIHIDIPDSVTSIGDSAFMICTSLKSVIIPDGVTTIGWNVFDNCSSLTSIVIPNSVTSIEFEAFSFCESLESIKIPDSITSIEDKAFIGCSSLTKIEVSENNAHYKSIDGNLYSKDEKTFVLYPAGKVDTSFTISNGVTSIERHAFACCESLTSIAIPYSVTSICYKTFSYCASLERIVIPSSVTSIGESAFELCISLESIVIPSSVTSIDEDAFYECNSLRDVYYTGSESEWNQIKIGSDNDDLTEATIHYNYIP